MKTLRWSTIRLGLSGLVAVGTVLASAPGTSLLAQDVDVSREACRCVDTDGNEIEDCTCFRTVRPEGMYARLFPLGESRARIGITLEPTQASADDARGARVTAVMDDGPAQEAGIQEGDIITRIDGQSLFEPLDGDREDHFNLDESIPVQRLLAIARSLDPDEEVEIEYLRDGDARTAMVETEELDSWGRLGVVSPNWDADALQGRMRDLTDRLMDVERGNLFRQWEPGDSLHEGEGYSFRFDTREGPRGWTVLREGAEPRGWTVLRDTLEPHALLERLEHEGPRGLTILREGTEPRVLLERLQREGERGNVMLRRSPEGNVTSFGFGSDWALMECPASGNEGDDRFFSFSSNCIGGLDLMELKPGLADYFGTESGVLVTDVHEESATGLQAGDVILTIGDRDTSTPDRARRILRSYGEGEDVTFRILRRTREMTVTGQLGR